MKMVGTIGSTVSWYTCADKEGRVGGETTSNTLPVYSQGVNVPHHLSHVH